MAIGTARRILLHLLKIPIHQIALKLDILDYILLDSLRILSKSQS